MTSFSKFTSKYGSIACVFGSELCDVDIAAKTETIVLNVVHLATCRTWGQFSTGLSVFASAMCNGQILKLVTKIVQEVQAAPPEAPDTPIEQAGDLRLAFGAMVDNWSAFKRTDLYKRFKRILALCVLGGLVSEAFISDHPSVFKRLTAGVDSAKHDALDMVEEVIHLARVVWDVISECVTTRSMGPLLGSSSKIVKAELEQAKLTAQVEWYMLGSLERMEAQSPDGTQPEEFPVRVQKQCATLKGLHAAAAHPAERASLARMLKEVNHMAERIRERATRGTMRKEPFTLKLDGTTGVGKTAITVKIARDILRVQKEPHGDDFISVVSATSAYFDTVTNYTKAIIMDDVKAVKAAFCRDNLESQRIIEVRNTMSTPVTKAAVEEKGGTFINASCFIMSTNDPTMGAFETATEPSATLRRCNFHIMVTVDPQYQKGGPGELKMLDGAKMSEGMYSRAQLFTVAEWVPLDRTETRADRGFFRTLERGLHYSELMEWLTPHIHEHDRRQQRMLEEMEEDVKHPLCEHGFTTALSCHKCRGIEGGTGNVALGSAYECQHDYNIAGRCRKCNEEEPSVQAGEFWNRIFDRAAPAAIDGVFLPPGVDLCEHALEVCPICHPPAPSPELPPVTMQQRMMLWRARFRAAWIEWHDTPMSVGEAPMFAWAASAFCGGFGRLENLFITHPQLVVGGLYSTAPAATFTVMRSAFWAFGLSGPLAPLMATLGAVFSVFTISHAAVSYVRGRVAGLSVSEVHKRLTKIAMGFAGVVICATLGGLVTAAAMRRLLGGGRDDTPTPDHASTFDYKFSDGGQPVVRKTAPPCETCHQGLASENPTYEQVVTLSVLDMGKAKYDPLMWAGRKKPTRAGPGLTEHGGCQSVQAPIEEPEAVRDPIARENVWTNRQLVTFRAPEPRVATMTRDMITAIYQRQLRVLRFKYNGSERVTMGLMICTNHLLLPAHNFIRRDGSPSEILGIEMRETSAERGGIFHIKVGGCSTAKMRGDAMVVQVNAGGTMQDLTRFLVDDDVTGELPVEELSRDLTTCELKVERYRSQTHLARSAEYGWQYPALFYTRQTDTFVGLCGALLVAGDRYARILGFHTMGVSGTRTGVGCLITKQGVLDALQQLRQKGLVSAPIVSQGSTDVYVPTGHEAAAAIGELSERSILREAPPGAPLLPMGTLLNYAQVRSKSNMGVSPMSALVSEQCGMPRMHEAPRNIGKITVEKRKLAELDGMRQLPPDLLLLAKADQQQELVAVMLSGDLQGMLQPLSEREALSGIPGSTGVQRVNLSTAAGFPLKGNKRPLVAPDPTIESPEAICLTPEQRHEIQLVEDRMARLTRVNFLFKASHKDEAVKIGKDKCRVFEAAPFALTYFTRKLFLPLMRLYALCQAELESAVGINAYGREWSRLAQRMKEFNAHKLLEGDWQHYDSSEAYQEVMTIFSMWIEIVVVYGAYTDREINVMWVVAEEIARHYALFRGDVTQIDGTNASGNGLTVFINNCVNGNRKRCAFYALCPPEVQPVECWALEGTTPSGVVFAQNARAEFRPLLPQLRGRFADYVRAIFYGDDFLLAVKDSVLEWYNHLTIAPWFAEQGKIMTDTNKQPFTRPHIVWNEASFLKRNFRFDADTGCELAPLDIKSIYKPLHMWPIKLAESKEVHAAEVIGGAINELFQHGRAEFEARVPHLFAVAKQFGCEGYLEEDLSYKTALARWNDANPLL